MIIKWFRGKPKGWMVKFPINFVGAFISFIVMMIFFITKFAQVWSVLIFLPLIVYCFHRINNYFESVGEQLRLKYEEESVSIKGNVIIVPVAGITQVVENSICYAKSITDQVIAVYVSFDREEEKRFEEQWKQWQPDVRLVTLHSHY